jgi:peptidoglycan/xylan/chitin deacetylase (PgdA/CDA1 family)
MIENMRHSRFEYSAIVDRSPLKFPKNANIAVWVNLNIEHFDYDKPALPIVPITAQFNPDVLNYSWRDYGNRVGIWRLIEILEKYDIPISASVNADVCSQNPAVIKAGNEKNWDWLGHGNNNSTIHTGLSEDEERSIIESVVNTLTEHTGKSPRGWLSPVLTETENTLDILAESGFEYVADWTNDDQPFAMKVKSGSLYSLPYSIEVNDLTAFLQQGFSASEYGQMLMDQFDVLYAEGEKNGRVMSIGIHPFSLGQAYRAKYFDKALEYIRGHDNVWFATGSEIIDWYRQTVG